MKATFQRPDRATTCAWSWYWLVTVLTLYITLAALLFLFDRYPLNRTITYTNPILAFQYGSIGTDLDNGLPLEIIKVLPRMFPEYLPEGSSSYDYSAFGFIQQPGHDMPIGFSKRTRILSFTNINCSACHSGVISVPGYPEGKVFPGMPSNTMDLQGFYVFLFTAAADPRFTASNLMKEMEKDHSLDLLERLIYPIVVPLLQGQLLTRQTKLSHYFGFHSDHPRWGPGRVDTFNTFKFDLFAELYGKEPILINELYGTVDLPSIWNQRIREDLKMKLHWDGNNDSVYERNISAALAAGATRNNIDTEKERLFTLQDWLMDTLKPPVFPWSINKKLSSKGKGIYRQLCYNCHDFAGDQIGKVVDINKIKTDRNRLDSYTTKFREIQQKFTKGRSWAFTHFEKTNGYANAPLDGIWARAPYLHNGSVPTIWHLLTAEEQRPNKFYIGDIIYDPKNLGFQHHKLFAPNGRKLMRFDTAVRGNGNQGHSGIAYGTELPDQDKWALIEYLKTL